MHVDVVVTPKVTKRIICAKFRVVEGALLFYEDARMSMLSDGFKAWRRFSVIPEDEATPIKLVEVNLNKSKNKKGA